MWNVWQTEIAQNAETNDDLNNDAKKHNEPIELFTFDTYIKHVWQNKKGIARYH